MRAILGFLKKNAFNLICGVIALASIGLGVLGMTKMTDVETELKGVSGMHGQFSSASRAAANDKTITAEQQRVNTVKQYYADLLQVAKSFNQYQPLEPPPGESFFPNPTRDGKLSFRRIYLPAFEDLYQRLNAGMPPSQADIADMQATMDEEKRAQQAFLIDEDETGSDDEFDPEAAAKEEPRKSGLITTAQARESAAARAAIRRARSIFCYADPETAFQRNERIVREGEFSVPDARDMWNAQMTLWVQQDVVESLARTNDLAADELRTTGGRAWVGVLPVKELISIRVSDYILNSSSARSRTIAGMEPTEPIGGAELAFTGNVGTETFDVVQFAVKLVVDARDLPMVIDEICRNRFHTLLDVEYEYDPAVLENLNMTGRIYGSEPAVIVLMDFETIFFGDQYRRLMPDEVLADIGWERPTDDDQS